MAGAATAPELLRASWREGPCANRLQLFLATTASRVFILPGGRGELALVHNPGRQSAKRPAANGMPPVLREWSESGFNFFRAPAEEIVLRPADSFFVLVNAFPIVHDHFLLVSTEKLPQVVHSGTDRFLANVLDFFVKGGFVNSWIALFNSFGAFASVNHLHVQIMPHPLDGPDHLLRLETARLALRQAFSWGGLMVPNEPGFRCIVLELSGLDFLGNFAAALHRILAILADQDIAHNWVTLRSDALFRIAILPRSLKQAACPGASLEPGGLELLGMLVVYDQGTFEGLGEAEYDCLRASVELTQPRFENLLVKHVVPALDVPPG
mmetsp:Transcript_16515/g.52645  ORF Transcript_16515/g.52645 Transcript_16515/m.52645 type:complete len:325 (+) Transcript_16515:186-1160(+)